MSKMSKYPSKADFKWKPEHMVRFLECFQRQEALWKIRANQYHDKTAREKAYETMVREINIDGVTALDVKKKSRVSERGTSTSWTKLRLLRRVESG